MLPVLGRRQNLFVFFSNSPGFLLSVWFNLCAAKLQYQDHRAKEMRQSFVGFLEAASQEMQRRQSTTILKESMQERLETEPLAEENDEPIHADDDFQTPWQTATDLGALVLNVTTQNTPAPAPHEIMVMCIVVIWTIIVAIVALAPVTAKTKELIIGITVNINLFFFYGAPLSSIVQVFKERNSASIHIRTMVTNTLNSCFWTAYGLAVTDAFIFVPNGIGAVLGVIQGILVLMFTREVASDHNPVAPATMVAATRTSISQVPSIRQETPPTNTATNSHAEGYPTYNLDDIGQDAEDQTDNV
jgi:solute carrier family 50 (sugar transporter)